MKGILRFAVAAGAVMFLFSAFAVTQAKSQNIVADIMKRMDKHYVSLKSLKANIRREKYNSQLKDTDAQEGKITLLPGKDRKFACLLEWTKPSREIISVVNGKYVAYVERTKIAYTGNSSAKTMSDKGGGILQILSMSKADIKANYDVPEYVGEEKIPGGVQTWHLKLVPKTKTSYKFADIWVDGNGMPVMVRVTFDNNDTDTALISSLQKNVKLEGKMFKVDLPEGTVVHKT